MMHIGNMVDVEQLIKDAKYARMEFVRKNLRLFVFYGSGLLGLFCAVVMTGLTVGTANRGQQAMQVSHAAKAISKPLTAVH